MPVSEVSLKRSKELIARKHKKSFMTVVGGSKKDLSNFSLALFTTNSTMTESMPLKYPLSRSVGVHCIVNVPKHLVQEFEKISGCKLGETEKPYVNNRAKLS